MPAGPPEPKANLASLFSYLYKHVIGTRDKSTSQIFRHERLPGHPDIRQRGEMGKRRIKIRNEHTNMIRPAYGLGQIPLFKAPLNKRKQEPMTQIKLRAGISAEKAAAQQRHPKTFLPEGDCRVEIRTIHMNMVQKTAFHRDPQKVGVLQRRNALTGNKAKPSSILLLCEKAHTVKPQYPNSGRATRAMKTTHTDRENSKFLPSPVASFLTQIADMPGQAQVNATSYAAAVILPKTGWDEDEFLDRLTVDLCKSENLTALERHLSRQNNAVFEAFTISLTARDGKKTAFTVQSRPTRLPEGRTVISSSLTPVNPSVDPMLSNWSSESRLISLLDALPVYVTIVDQTHVIRYENKMFRQLFGRGKGQKCYKIMRGRDTPCPTCGPLAVIASQAVAISEWASEKLNSAFRVHSYPCTDPAGNKAVLKVGMNITAGVRAQNALDISEQRYRNIADNLTVGVALLDPTLKVLTANPRMAEWFGPEASKGAFICDILQRRCEELTEGCTQCLFRQCLEDGLTHEFEFSLITYDGSSRHFRQVVCPILDRRKERRGTLMMLEDVTERHKLAVQMQQLRRLEAMGSLAGGIAHEINQPLSALHLYAGGLQMLLEQGGDISQERVIGRLELILKQADKIREIIDHMRALVMQEEAAPPSATSVSEAVDSAMNLVGAQLSAHNVSVEINLPDDLPEVLASPVQLEQVFINLLINAMHALDTVEIPKKLIRIEQGVSEPGLSRIRVMDNGPGIQGLEDKIFDPFFTTKEAHLGMGLGLSIVHSFVHSWGGSIRVRSNGAKPGTAFTITMKTADTGEVSSENTGS